MSSGKSRTSRQIARYLASSDPILATVIKRVRELPEYYRQRTHFETICRIIVGQQLSYGAAGAIWNRLRCRFYRWTPQALSAASVADLRGAGLSAAKAMFIRELSIRLTTGKLSLRALARLRQAEVLDRLETIKGFGPWSREMFLIFALGYPDVFSCGDRGLQRAITSLYAISGEEYAARAEMIAEQWRPFRSYACRYLWHWLDQH
jgi:DNA-3-methyladenine glycosylase II